MARCASARALANGQTAASAAEELSISIREIGGQVGRSSTIVSRAVAAGTETRATIETLNEQVGRIGAVADMIQAACTARVVDISQGGAHIRGGPSLPEGTRVTLQLDGVGFALPCVVRGNEESSLHLIFAADDATQDNRLNCVGVRSDRPVHPWSCVAWS